MTVLQRITELQGLARSYRADGLVVGLCHGCFDIVHLGHIHHLRQASTLVDRLFVSITADEYVNKGPNRPIFPARVRAEFIASIRYCDRAIVNQSPTAESVISTLRPDVFFKGADYRSSTDPRINAERALVENSGGRVVLTNDAIMDSTSRIAHLILSESA
ncbi:adenylyltransferase/cytidyltransferase family protein [Burkholderia sp. ABCPW 14]|uniref:adenylyltransferase/cytidyltransferase family protein n=1 Tax=Burkholderia sp. ABCPW 14 TaxID=1637860 RepID=UPI0009E668CA|nr:adenylyltransferase/cytidyltransferase family protein [Burkholderia sp. ABCPW 14]